MLNKIISIGFNTTVFAGAIAGAVWLTVTGHTLLLEAYCWDWVQSLPRLSSGSDWLMGPDTIVLPSGPGRCGRSVLHNRFRMVARLARRRMPDANKHLAWPPNYGARLEGRSPERPSAGSAKGRSTVIGAWSEMPSGTALFRSRMVKGKCGANL